MADDRELQTGNSTERLTISGGFLVSLFRDLAQGSELGHDRRTLFPFVLSAYPAPQQIVISATGTGEIIERGELY